jgi:hypothetical protein
MDGERHPLRTGGHRHGRNHSPDPAAGDRVGGMLTEARDGKAVRGWFYRDQLALLAQLGITEQPGLFLSAEGFQSGQVCPRYLR